MSQIILPLRRSGWTVIGGVLTQVSISSSGVAKGLTGGGYIGSLLLELGQVGATHASGMLFLGYRAARDRLRRRNVSLGALGMGSTLTCLGCAVLVQVRSCVACEDWLKSAPRGGFGFIIIHSNFLRQLRGRRYRDSPMRKINQTKICDD